ncbi:hypothetical protein VTN00DRAFT_4180 [Thermoascus crustaceus]|uniref:uncharacterized protein n=1 Tax=Thermoascus crustaceus TaxID=5088 RepID=UPI003743865B
MQLPFSLSNHQGGPNTASDSINHRKPIWFPSFSHRTTSTEAEKLLVAGRVRKKAHSHSYNPVMMTR